MNEVMTINIGPETIRMVPVVGGTFWMGADNGIGRRKGLFRRERVETAVRNFDPQASNTEKPVHMVTVGDFYISEKTVSGGLWQLVKGDSDGKVKCCGDDSLAVNIEWNEAKDFIRNLNGMTGKKFRLPTEAEWEFAARGGNSSNGYRYAGSDDPVRVAWYGLREGHFSPGQKYPNELGLFDMSGNLREWCEDTVYDYGKEPETDPCHVVEWETYHITRGGASVDRGQDCRVTARSSCYSPFGRGMIYDFIGFRLAMSGGPAL